MPLRVPAQAPLALVLSGLMLFSGCVSSTVKHDYSTFSDSYARDMNWQMLMNLARLDQGHPPYFVAIGEFKLNRTHTVGLNFDGTRSTDITDDFAKTPVTQAVKNVTTRLWKPNASTSATPQMSFIPMNSEETSRQLLQPVPAELFVVLLEQGWRVDHLLRILVERVEFNDGDYYNNGYIGGNLSSYLKFLRYAEIMRELQENRQLKIGKTKETFSGQGSLIAKAPSPKEINEAAAQQKVWKKDPENPENQKGWQLGVMRSSLKLEPTKAGEVKLAEADKVEIGLRPDSHFAAPEKKAKETAADYLKLYKEQLAKKNKNEGGGLKTDAGTPPVITKSFTAELPGKAESLTDSAQRETKLVFRSYRAVLGALALEQYFWSAFTDKEFVSISPELQRQRRATLAFWDSKPALPGQAAGADGLSLTYGGRSYRVADGPLSDPPLTNAVLQDSRWNHDVFRLLVQVSSQVAVDISKFQRTVLQISP